MRTQKAPTKSRTVSRTAETPAARAAAPKPAPLRTLLDDKDQGLREFRSEYKLKQETIARLLGISLRTVATYEATDKPLSAKDQRGFKEIQRLLRALAVVIPVNGLSDWLYKTVKALDDQRPIDLIERGEIDRIWAMIYQFNYGVS